MPHFAAIDTLTMALALILINQDLKIHNLLLTRWNLNIFIERILRKMTYKGQKTTIHTFAH